MPVESRAGDAPPHLAATSRPVVLHRQRVPGAVAGALAARVGRQQLYDDVSNGGLRSRHVHAAAEAQPNPRCREASARAP